jgi:hypothetical protein
MNSSIPPHEQKGNASNALIFRLVLGAVFVCLSVGGISLCRDIFRTSTGPGSVPGDSSFANLGAWAAWALFFAPLAIGGVALVWSTLRKMGALDRLGFWLEDRAGRPDAVLSKANQSSGLESLSTETVERLQRTAARAATILGALAGAFLLCIGIVGLVSLFLFSRPPAGSPVYLPLGTGRITFTFALFSGMLVFVGFAILQRTFRRDNSSWLFPLRLFTYVVVRRMAGERTSLTEQQRPRTKQLPRV